MKLVTKLLLALVIATAIPAVPGGLAGGAVHTVDVFNFGFADGSTGAPVTIAAVGDSVRFTVSSGVHTVTDGVAGRENPAGAAFDSGILMSGQSFVLPLTAPGVIAYTCALHANMQGFIVVGA